MAIVQKIAKRSGFKSWRQGSVDYINNILQTGLIVAYSLTGKNANLAAVTLETPSTPGLRRATAAIIITTVDGASSTMPKVTLGWTDADNATAQTHDLTATSAGNVLTTKDSGTFLFNPKLGVAVTVATSSYASGTSGIMQYSLYVTIEAL